MRALRAAVLVVATLALPARADYVGSQTNRIFLDPDAIADLLDGYDNGDELGYIMETTPADTGSTNGHAAWQTLFVPAGVEVIGVEFVKASGTGYVAIPAEHTDQTYAGWGARGSKSYAPTSGTTQLANGYVNEVQQDSGIFYSTDSRTQTTTTQILPQITPTGPDTKPAVIYNQWDYDQVVAFGTSSALSGNKGQGNTPLLSTDSGGAGTWIGTGSPVAGPLARYTNDYNPACNGAAACTGTVAQCEFAADLQCTGPWQRIAYSGSRFGGSGTIVPAAAPGSIVDSSVATAAGATVSGASPLPAGTNAIRWVHGQRTLGDIELSRVRFRITDAAAFLASFEDDTFCLESTGGDTSDTAAKDNNWRYYEPVHQCYAALGGPPSDAILLKQFTHVDGTPGNGSFLNTNDIVAWQVTFTNTGAGTLTNVTLTDTPDTANLTLVEPGAQPLCPYASYNGDIPGPAYVAGSATLGTAQWAPVPSLAPGASFTVSLCGEVGSVSSGDVVSNTAGVTYTHPDTTIDTLSSTAGGSAGGGRIAGRVLLDPDADGDPGDNDQGIPGVTVELWNDSNNNGQVDGGDTLRESTSTLADGSYEFLNVPAGNYVVRETNPPSIPSSADKDTTAGNCASGNGCDQIDVTLPANTSSLGNDFYDTGDCLVDADCDNGVFCDGAETCADYACVTGTDPCLAGDVCGTQCNESTDDCFVTAGTVCRTAVDDCDVEEVCSGSSTACPPDAFQPASTLCGDQSSSICDSADTCNASGVCLQNIAPVSTSCGDPLDTACDNPDTCDGAGMCLANADPGSPMCTNADLAITKVDLTGQVQAGAFTTYEITVENLGPANATAVTVTDTLDANTTYVASSLPCVQGPIGTLTCSLGAMTSGSTRTFQVVVYIDPSAPTASSLTGPSCPGSQDVCNRVVVTSATPDSNSANNQAEVATDVIVATTFSELSMTKIDVTAEPVAPGANVTYQIEVTNNGPDTATDVVVYDSLDPFMTWVSDDAGCTVTGVGSPLGTQLACPLGDIPSGSSATLNVVVTIAMNAPLASTLQDGDCNDLEDVCNFAVVGTSSSDVSFPNNDDSEPTDVAAPVLCGNGMLNPGEQCDPPSGEICNNTIDDDGDLLIDCGDPDCMTPGFQSCDAACQLTLACVPILDDPARIRTNSVWLHGRFIPTTPVDPAVDGFIFLLANEDGEILRWTLLPGDMVVRGDPGPGLKRWEFKDRTARKGPGLRNGIYRVEVKERPEKDGTISYPFRIRVFGDMSRAIHPTMTTLVYLGTDVGGLTAEWRGKPGNWSLSKKDADAGR